MVQKLNHQTQQLMSILACLLAAFLWGLFWYPLRLLEDMGVSGLWSSLLIYAFALFVLLPFAVKSLLRISSWRTLILLGLFSGWANLAFIFAMLEGSVVRGLLLFYLSPIWTVVLGLLILKEPINKQDYSNVVLGLTGAVIILWNAEFSELLNNRADWFALSAGVAFSLNNIYIRKSGDVPITAKMFSAWFGVLLFAGLGILSQGALSLPSGQLHLSNDILLLAGVVGIIGMSCMTFTAQYGVTHIPVNQSAILFLFEVPVGAVSAALLAGEKISLQEWLGGFCILLAAFLTAQTSIKQSSSAQS